MGFWGYGALGARYGIWSLVLWSQGFGVQGLGFRVLMVRAQWFGVQCLETLFPTSVCFLCNSLARMVAAIVNNPACTPVNTDAQCSTIISYPSDLSSTIEHPKP